MWITLLPKKLIAVLVLNFKAMFSALVKDRKKDFCKVLPGKGRKCCDTANASSCFITQIINEKFFEVVQNVKRALAVCHGAYRASRNLCSFH